MPISRACIVRAQNNMYHREDRCLLEYVFNRMSVVKVSNALKEEASDIDDDEKSGKECGKVYDDDASGQDHDDLIERFHDDSGNQSPI